METTSVKCFEIRNSTYEIDGGQELIFKIPKNINLINQKDTYLKFNLRLGGKDEPAQETFGQVKPSAQIKYCLDRNIGAEALIKNITIMTLDESKTLEQITNYNRLAKIVSTYSDNSTHKNIKNLYEGRGDLVCLGTKNQLWELKNLSGAGDATQSVNALTYKTIEVCLPLRHSGILGGQDLYPNMLTGLCVKIQLEDDAFKVLQAQGQVLLKDTAPQNADNSHINRVGGYTNTAGYAIEKIGGGTCDNNSANFRIKQAGGATTQIAPALNTLGSGVLTGTDPTGGNNLGTACLPFTVGSLVKIKGNHLEETRAINNITYAGGHAQFTLNAAVDFTAAGPGGATNTEANVVMYIIEPAIKPNLTLSNVELIVGAVVPNDKMRNNYMAAVNSKGGYSYNYYSTQNYPVNNSKNSTVISNLINCKLSKAKSILSSFEDIETARTAVDDCLASPITPSLNPKNYHYIIDNLKTPSRNVDVSRYARNPNQTGGFNAVHIKELADTFKECNKVVETLEPLKENFVIGRALSRYNHSYNFLEQRGETRFNCDFVRNENSLLNHNFIYHWKQMIVSPQGVEVVV